MLIRYIYILFMLPGLASALTPVTLPDASANFLSIDNLAEDNIYLTTLTTGPRITGTLNFTSNPSHSGLAYLSDGADRKLPDKAFQIAIWEHPLVFDQPYAGLHCWKYFGGCTNSIMYPEYTKLLASGFDMTEAKFTPYGEVINPKLSNSFIHYLNNLPAGATYTSRMHYCWTTNTAKKQCIEAPPDADSKWEQRTVSFTKIGRLRFQPNNNTTDVMVGSDGTFKVLPGSNDCVSMIVGAKSGLVCRYISFDFQFTKEENFDVLSFYISLIDGTLSSQTATNDLQISTDKSYWVQRGAYLNLRQFMFGRDSLYVFLSNDLLKKMMQSSSSGDLKSMVKFNTHHTLTPGSGFYEFNGTANIHLKSRKMSVSILAKDGESKPYRMGIIGHEKINFDYNIAESGGSSAEKLEVTLRQDTGTPFNGNCTFYPTNRIDNNFAVPIPSRLIFSSQQQGGNNVLVPIRCDGQPIDLRQHKILDSRAVEHWSESDGSSGSTRFYNLGLQFDLIDAMAHRTVNGDDWEGEVHQSGTITLKGVWH